MARTSPAAIKYESIDAVWLSKATEEDRPLMGVMPPGTEVPEPEFNALLRSHASGILRPEGDREYFLQ